MDYLRRAWYLMKSKTPHQCENWQTFLRNQSGGVLFCSVCAKIIDEEAARDE
jgi:hypothetical protein